MKCNYLAVLLVLGCASASAQTRLSGSIWQELAAIPAAQKTSKSGIQHIRQYQLQMQQLAITINQQTEFTLPVPTANGQLMELKFTRNNVLPPALAVKYSELFTFDAIGLWHGQSVKGKFEFGPKGLFGSYKVNGQRLYLQPVAGVESVDQTRYQLFDPAQQTRPAFNEVVRAAEGELSIPLDSSNRAGKPVDGKLRQYTIVITNTGEYAGKHGGTVASVLDELATVVNRLNQVFEVDMGVTFVLSEDNDKVIFTNASSDPFNNDDGDIDLAQDVIDDAIGVNNYDIGHVLTTNGGGLAGVSSICSPFSKADGMTGLSNPSGDRFYIDLVAHEIGHQLGAHHTFNGTSGSCDGGRSGSHAYEPGSGSTIMSYAGLCGSENIPSLQSSSVADDYFHVHSIEQHQSVRSWRTCGVDIDGGNQAPTADAGADYVIPANSPFMLNGSAVDADNDPLLYSWEQFDLGGSSNSAASMATDDGSRPLFRSRPPQISASRYLPLLSDVINGTSTKGEALPSTERMLTFKLTVRDNQGGVAIDDMQIQTTLDAQPLQLLAPKAFDTWFNNSPNTLLWEVGDTDLPPVNCAHVDVWLSTNNGQDFSTLVERQVVNDGEHELQLNLSGLTTSARVMLQCSDNIFIAVNDGAFTIVSPPNRAPVAEDDIYEVDQDSTDNLFAVLNNDSDPDEDSLTLVAVDYDGDASITIDNDNIVYSPVVGFAGVDSFSYSISDPSGASAHAVVSVTINETPNTPPAANADSFVVEQDSTNNIFDVLDNDSDVDNDAISIVAVDYSGAGTLAITGDTLTYTPATGVNGSDSFSYSIADSAGLVATAVVSITVNPVASNPPPTTTPPSTPTSSSGGGAVIWWHLYLLSLLVLVRKLRLKNEG